MSAPTTFPEPNPAWVLETLINFMIGEYEDAAAEYAKGRPHFNDFDKLSTTAASLAFLHGLSGGRYGLSSDQLDAIRTEFVGGAR